MRGASEQRPHTIASEGTTGLVVSPEGRAHAFTAPPRLMSFEHLDAAAELEGLPPAPKTVLIHVAKTACLACGLAWPGVFWIERKTGLGRTAIKSALERLVADGWLKIHAYPKGGRGMSTEYVVMPMVMELSTAPCGECRRKLKRGRKATSIDDPMTAKGATTRPVSAIPVAQAPQNRSPGDPQSVIESESVTRARARSQADPPASPTGLSEPPTPNTDVPDQWTTQLKSAKDALQRVIAMVGSEPTHGLPSPATVKPGPSGTATASRWETAQDDGQTRDGLPKPGRS